jgi:hypothetical protein
VPDSDAGRPRSRCHSNVLSGISEANAIRCFIDHTRSLDASVNDKTTWRIANILESYQFGFRDAQFKIVDSSITLICISQTGSGLKLDELRTAFGDIIGIEYRRGQSL